MGNTTSTPRNTNNEGSPEELGYTQNDTDMLNPDAGAEGRGLNFARRNNQSLRAAGQRASALSDAFRRQRSSESINSRQNAGHSSPFTSEIEYEQEDRPLVGREEMDLASAAPTTTLPMTTTRRRSAVSRLGSRLLPDPVARGLLSNHDETVAEGRASRQRTSQRLRQAVYERPPNSETNTRLSLTSSLRRNNDFRADARRRPIRGPFPLQPSRQSPDSGNSRSESVEDFPELTPPPTNDGLRYRNRLSRVRDSISISRLSGLFGPSSEQPPSNEPGRESPPRPVRVTFADESDHLLPSLPSHEHRLDSDDTPHELDAVEPEARTLLSGHRVTSGMSTIRRFQPALRPRSTQLIRRGEHPPLSQVLQLAAAAIAAQLSGHGTASTPGGRQLGSDTFDGSIQNFVQTLQDAATAQAGESIDMNASDGDLPPVNFMRVFQFPNDENGSPIASQALPRDVDRMDLDSIAGPGESDRSVTLVLVGVRSLPHGHENSGGEGTLGPSLDTLLSLPFLPPANVLRNGSSGALFRRSDGRNRSNARRHSMTNFSFPAQYETQRHQRTRAQTGRGSGSSEQPIPTTPEPGVTSNLALESPPGPHPPPSTPADLRSGHATPIRRPSSASATPNPTLPELNEGFSHYDNNSSSSHNTNNNAPSESALSTARQRRRSDSEFARRPELGSGAARRNGMVEPDSPPSGAGRSWLIYVVGTNVSPDHPAFTMPSLFTDNPSYEDMQMLSTLLGPVKPPVATQEEVSSAGGLFRLIAQDSGFLGEVMSEGEELPLLVGIGERCLICLSDYAPAEEVRRLDKCKHLYHRECIDEWLTTGRNSCPMCRGQAVGDSGSSSSTDAGAPPLSA